MSQNVGLSRLLHEAREGSQEAENRLAEYFLNQAISAAQKRLVGKLPAEDHEDIAVSAVKSFCMGIRSGTIEYQGDRQLFALLRSIVDSKVRKLWQYHFAQKRSLERQSTAAVEEQSRFAPLPGEAGSNVQVSNEDQPAVDRILIDLQSELHGLFGYLVTSLDEHPRKLLLMLLETDATNEQLAQKIGRSVASIERYRNLIRKKLEEVQS
ncbi:MAG: ECF-type sigma factor [Planctomycetota bacterium]